MIDLTRNKWWGLVLLAVSLGLVASASVVRHTRSNQHDQVAHVDSTVELSCDLSYEYRDDLEWKKLNGRKSDKARAVDGKLVITGLTALDAGEYECFTDYGKSSIVKLTVQPAAGKAQPNAHLAASPMNEFERELDTDVELFCALSRGNENDIKWRKIGGEMSEFNREYDGKVLIYYLSAEDSGEYECYLPTGESRRVVLKVTAPKEYENEYDASSHSNEHHKNVQAQQVFPQENAEAAASEQVSAVYQETRDSEQIPSELIGGETIAANHDKVVDAGANVELSCIYTSSSPDNLKWKKINDKLSDYAREHLGKLYIFYSTPQDAGEYECYLPNGQSAVVKLTVNPVRSANDHQELEGEVVPNDDEPVVEDRKEIVRVEKKVDNFDQVAEHDSNVQLACELTEGHESELKWKKLEGTLSQYGRDHLGKLYIYYVNQHDSGEYECFLPSGEFRRVKLTVNGGQKNEEPVVAPVHHSPAHHVPEDANKNYDLEVELNQHAELDCKHRLGNENTLKWKKLNGEINPYAREHQGKLYIYYASKQDAGVYECYLPSGESSQVNLAIKNDNVEAAQDRSSAVYNEPEVKEQPESAADNQYVLEVEGNYDEVAEINSNVELSCRYTNQHQNGLQWKKLDGTLSQYTRVHEGKLFIYYISEQDEGEYECYLPDGSLSRAKLTVNRPAEQTHSLSASSHVQPVAAPHQPASESESGYDVAYASSRENHDKQAEINDNIELTCGLSQSNEDTINWRKIDGEMSDYSRPYAGKLYIYYLKQEDAGDYECSLPNGQSERVRVTVNGGGRNDDAPQEPAAKQSATDDERVHEQEEQSFDKEVEFNTNVELSCKFTQSHAQNLRWRKRDGQLKYNTRESQGKLMIYYANEYNQGDYECYLPNGQSSVVKLTVRDSSASAPAQNTNTYNNPSNYQRSDESYAVRAYVSKSELKLRYGSSDENTCTGMTNGDSMEIKWYNSRGQLLKDDQSIKIKTSLTSQEPLTKVSVFTVLSASSSSVDTIECRVIVGRKIESAKFKVLLDNGRSSYQNSQELVSATKVYNILPLAASRRQFCGVNEATCANGQCIPRTGLCDGRQDCQDGSDENNCSADSSGCQPNERACRNGVCKEKFWFCDGEKDCEDGSDEESCPPARPGETCKPDEFECKSRKQCIKKGFVCDNEFDCEDKSDEIGCQKPSAITFPIRNLRVREGETFTIECQAGGFPEPYINWRKNWGHICKEPRCTTSTRNGFGTLTVRNAQLDDVGAYSCEAMNSQGREFIGPDTLVEIEETYERPQQPREEYEPREDLQPCGEGTTAEYRSGCGEEQTPEPTPAYEESRCGDETTPAEYRSGCGEERTEPPPPPPVEEESRCGEETTPAESRGCGEPEPTQPPPPEVEEESRPCGYEAAEQRSGCGHEQPTYPPPPPEVHEEESRPCGYQETTEAAEQRSGCGHEQPTYPPPPPEVHEEESRPCGYQETTEAAEQRSGCGHEQPTYPPPPPEVHEEESRPCGYQETTTPAQSSSCFCNNHANECDCHGQCNNCQHNTHGAHCEMCLPGFFGDATRGTPYDCSPYEPPREEESRPCGYSRCGEEQPPEPEPQREEESRPCGSEDTTTEAAEQRSGCGHEQPTYPPPPPEVHEEESRPCGYQETTEAAEQRSGCGHEEPTYPPPPPEVHEEESRPCGYQETTEAAEQRSGCGHEQPTYPPPPEVHEEESRPCGYQETTEAAEQRSGCGHEEPTYPPPEVQDESHPCGYNDYATPAQSSSCSCNNHSDKCTCGGFCYECQHNTEGQNCERCAPGYYGDATMGTPYDCKPIHSRNSQRFPAEELREPYQAPRRQSCDPDGTATDLGHSCRCKSGVIGTYCDQCAPKHFNMLRAASQQSSSKPSRRGCLSCFCNGLDVDCQSSNLNYEAVTSSFEYGADEWKISDRFTRLKEDVEANENGIEFTRFDEYQDKETDLYFIPSRKFGGNRLSSYGGYLNFSIEYEGVFENFKQLEIRISGNRINIYHVYDATLKPGSKYDITLQLVESEFKRYGDNGRVDRDHFLMTLQNIELIMIRASFVRQQHKVRLSDVSLQHAELNGSMNRASSVEVCRCPIGYTGNSCEDCAPGYRRSKIGFYLGLCEPEYFKY